LRGPHVPKAREIDVKFGGKNCAGALAIAVLRIAPEQPP